MPSLSFILAAVLGLQEADAASRHLARLADPWMDEPVGSWYRVRTSAQNLEILTDMGLAERGRGYYVLVSQTYARGEAGVERKTRVEPGSYVVTGQRVVPFGSSYLGLLGVERSGERETRQWIVDDDGPHGGARLGTLDPGGIQALALESVRLKDRAFECLRVEAGGVKVWHSAAYPLGAVRTESRNSVTELVDFGPDWSKRPPFGPAPAAAPAQPAEPEKPPIAGRVRQHLDDAARLIAEAVPLFRQVAEGTEAWPSEQERLAGLLGLVERLERQLLQAQFHYRMVRYDYSDTVLLDRRLKALEDLVEVLRAARKELRAALE